MPSKKSTLPLLFSVVVVVIVVIAISIGLRLWHDIKADRVKDLHYTSSVLKRYYELSFNQWRNTLLNLGQRLVAIDGKNKDSVRLEVANAAIKNYDDLLAFGFASPEGQVLTFSNSQLGDSLPNLMQSENSRRSFLKSKEVEFMSIGEAYYFPNVSDWVLPLRVPIRDEHGNLLAVNTTALQYKVLNIELNSFGFDSHYKIHMVNEDFNTNQFYHPMPIEDYSEFLRKEANIYEGIVKKDIGGIEYFETRNTYENGNSLLMKVELKRLNHTLYVSVDRAVLWNEMQPVAFGIAIIFTMLIAIIGWLFWYSKRKEKEYLSILVESEANLKSIFESTDNIIGLFNGKKELIEFNRAFVDAAKLTEGIQLQKGMGIDSLTSKAHIASLFHKFQDRALNGDSFKETIEYPVEGGNLYFMLSYNPIYQNDRVTGLSMFVEDITELKTYQNKLEEQTQNLEKIVKSRTEELESKNEELEDTLVNLKSAQQKLVQAEKMASLGVLSAGIGHEINNPLNFIKNGASALVASLESMEKVDMAELKPFFDIIDDGVTRANSIVKSLSHFSRQVKTMKEECSLNDIINNCLTILHSRLTSTEVVKDLQSDCPIIVGNEGKLHQAILNLITNAEQSIREKGTISIKTWAKDNKLMLEITDNGEGIAPENIAKIADPFFTTKKPGEGTGLGLFIAYNIIEEHNGHVDLQSKLGEGTTFVVTFSLS